MIIFHYVSTYSIQWICKYVKNYVFYIKFFTFKIDDINVGACESTSAGTNGLYQVKRKCRKIVAYRLKTRIFNKTSAYLHL